MFSSPKWGTTRCALLGILAGILVAAPGAGAQSAADQYVPQLDRGGASAAASQPPAGAVSEPPPGTIEMPDERAEKLVPGEVRDTGSGSGGSAPGGGTPLTPLVAVLVVLLVGGLLARIVLRVIQTRAETV